MLNLNNLSAISDMFYKIKYEISGDFNQSKFDLVSMDQTHSNLIAFVDRTDNGFLYVNHDVLPYANSTPNDDVCYENNDHPNSTAFKQLKSSHVVKADALITKDSNIILAVKTADCLPILVVSDPYIAVIHAGRVGTLLNISYDVARYLRFLGGLSPLIWLGPHSCVCCYEIDQETGTHFNMLEENYNQLLDGFGDIAQFESTPFCTQCDNDYFYSYRSGDLTERNVFYLKKK